MEAIFYTEFGDADCLQYGSLLKPRPGPGQALVEVEACGLNPIDVKTRAGLGFVAAGLQPGFCFVPGYDLSGVVSESQGDLLPGTPVVGMVNFPARTGACAQFCVAPVAELVVAPQSIPLADAAALPLAGLTAWQGLFVHGGLQSGQRLLVLAGAGGVGHLAIQLGKWAGAEVAATGSAGNQAFLQSLGVDLALDYESSESMDHAGKWDLILDLVGGKAGREALNLLAPEGLMLTVPTATAAQLIECGDDLGYRVQGYTVRPDSNHLQQLVGLIDSGVLKLHVEARFPISQTAAAHRLQETGHVRGKIILEVRSSLE